LAKQEKWAEAEVLEVGAMETRKRTLGMNHPKTLTSMASVAWAFQQQGRYQEAKELETQVLEHRTRLLGLFVCNHFAFTPEGRCPTKLPYAGRPLAVMAF
jgi:hypothetical protein